MTPPPFVGSCTHCGRPSPRFVNRAVRALIETSKLGDPTRHVAYRCVCGRQVTHSVDVGEAEQ